MTRRSSLVFLIGLAGLILPAAAQADFGIVPGSLDAVAKNKDGTVTTQAGAHPYEYEVAFRLNADESGHTEGGEVRDLIVDLPPGFVGNPLAAPRCPRALFEGFVPHCPPNTQVGVLSVVIPGGFGQVSGPLYNMVAPPGVAGQLGFSLANNSALQNVSVRTDEGYGLRVTANSVPIEVSSVKAHIWGVPADASHDDERGQGPASGEGGATSSDARLLPFVTMPASCDAPLQIAVKVDSKLAPGVFDEESAVSLDGGGNPAPQSGCDAVPFSPGVLASPTTELTSNPSGLDFELKLPNQGLLSLGSIAETEPHETVVTLPQGVAVNPSVAQGIAGCTPAQYKAEQADTPTGGGCPEASKLGDVVARTPLVEDPIEGSVYLAAPHDNPFGTLTALYLVAKAPERGAVIKQAGRVDLDPATGQITATFDGLPPIPYSSFKLHLREGPRAPLTTPQFCGAYNVGAKLYPFSAPNVPVEKTVPFSFTAGANGNSCASSEPQLPLHPTLQAGTVAPIAGAYSPFVFKVSRSDGDQHLAGIDATLPEGLVGKLAGVTECSAAQIAATAARSGEGGGAVEVASPSCPKSSEVGVVNVGVGSGDPFYVQGHAYLAGPYKGAPLSLEIVTPALAGPFDLGAVAVRTALYVNETTAQIHAVSDSLPTILQGIPLDIRSIALNLDRSQFALNPTSCEEKQVSGQAISTTGQAALLSNRFQVGGCKGLAFKPKLSLTLKGKTQRGKNPALRAVLTQPPGQANISRVAVTLPKSEFIDNRHINNPCTRVQFNAGAGNGAQCPAKSILGYATAYTPLLDKPLHGAVYFRSNGGERQLPDLVASLDGQVHLNVVGFIDSVHKKGAEVSRTRNTFAMVPDAPVSKFVLSLKGGKKGLLQNSANLCKVSNVATVKFTGQNGKLAESNDQIANGCGGKRGKKGKGGGGKKSRR